MNRSIVLFLSLYLFLISCKQNQYADTIIYGGTIYTVDSINSVVEAVAVKDDKILKTGNLSEVKKLINSETKEINLEKRQIKKTKRYILYFSLG